MPKTYKTKLITFKVDPEWWQKVKDVAHERRVSASQIVREAIEFVLRKGK